MNKKQYQKNTMEKYTTIYTFAMWTYAGQLVQVEIPENRVSAAADKARCMAATSRGWIDIDEGIVLNDVRPY